MRSVSMSKPLREVGDGASAPEVTSSSAGKACHCACQPPSRALMLLHLAGNDGGEQIGRQCRRRDRGRGE